MSNEQLVESIVVADLPVTTEPAVTTKLVVINEPPDTVELAFTFDPPDSTDLPDAADSASELAEIQQPEPIPEEPVLAEDIESPFVLADEPQEIAQEPELPSRDVESRPKNSIVYQYNDQGRLWRESLVDNKGKVVSTYEYSYDSRGNQISRVMKNRTGARLAETTYTYDASGKMIAAETRDAGDSMISSAKYTYDSQGNLTAIYTYDSQGNLTAIYTYDSQGNLTDRQLFNSEGEDQPVSPQEPASPSEPVSVVMETLRPVETAPPLESASALEAPALPPPVPEQRTAQVVPPVWESWRQPSSPLETPAPLDSRKDEPPSITQEPSTGVDDQPEERILQQDYPITFSRVARVTVGQLVEIPFRGRDWVFLGEVGARRGIAYDSRKLDTEGESFIFRVDAAGVYTLKFYRQDFVHDLILNDHVQIIAGGVPETTGLGWFNPPTDRSRVVAEPRWPNFLEQPTAEAVRPIAPSAAVQPEAPSVSVQPPVEAVRQAAPPAAAPPTTTISPPASRPSPARNESARPQVLSGESVAQSSPVQSPSQPPPPAAESTSPDSIMKEAREEFNAGRIASAVTLLDQFRKSFPSGSDEVWWLYGQCYEANSPNRNVLAALDYYRRIVREYPQSSRLSDARRRISYLERYYINIQ